MKCRVIIHKHHVSNLQAPQRRLHIPVDVSLERRACDSEKF